MRKRPTAVEDARIEDVDASVDDIAHEGLCQGRAEGVHATS